MKQRQSKDGQSISSKLLGANLADINIEKFRDLSQYNKDKYEVGGKFTIPLLKTITNKFSPAVMFTIVLPSQGISNIDPLSECLNLMILNLSRNSIENLSSLRKLKKLKIVNLADNAICNIDCFSNCQDLVNLKMQGNMLKGINSMSSLATCPSLKNLHLQTLSGNQQNPICELNNYRSNVFEFLPQISRLDSVCKNIELSNGSELKMGKKKEIKMQIKNIGPFYTNKFPSIAQFVAPNFASEQSFKKAVSSCKSAISQFQIRLKAAMAV